MVGEMRAPVVSKEDEQDTRFRIADLSYSLEKL